MSEAMTDMRDQAYWKGNGLKANLKKALAKNHACYVLITCTEPSADGKMEVEMTYEGDACLASYLIESAQGSIDLEE